MNRANHLFLTSILAALALLATSTAATAQQSRQQSRQQQANATGLDAYIYLYPLVTMDITRLQLTNIPQEKAEGILGPMNEFHHFRAFPDVNFKTVVRPNFDTLYSTLWADLTKEPLIVSVPDSGGRYYMLPMLDMWTDVFAVPGWRTTGTGPGHYAYVPPGWQALPVVNVVFQDTKNFPRYEHRMRGATMETRNFR